MRLSLAARPTPLALLRLLAAWLVVILLMQGFQGALNLGGGPRHSHGPGAGPGVLHAHGDLQRHHHPASDASVQADPTDTQALDDAARALSLAMSLMACGGPPRFGLDTGHIQRPALPWSCRSVVASPPRRPPRRG
ncbi:MAG: hypothetical protein RJA10_2360 [Pseudomonadota bacterium]